MRATTAPFNRAARAPAPPPRRDATQHRDNARRPTDRTPFTRASLGACAEAVVCEVQRLALQACVAMSAVEGLMIGDGKAACEGLRRHAPEAPSPLLANNAGAHEAEMSLATIAKLILFLGALEEARATLPPFFADVRAMGAARASILHYGAMTLCWCIACAEAAAAVAALDEELEDMDAASDIYRRNAAELVDLARASAAGRRPCLDDAGQLFVPDLPQRRRSPRTHVNQSCVIQYRGRQAPAFLKDASAGGLGLLRCPAFAHGESVSVVLGTGRRLSGRVAWSKGGAAGVSLDARLDPIDPLMFG